MGYYIIIIKMAKSLLGSVFGLMGVTLAFSIAVNKAGASTISSNLDTNRDNHESFTDRKISSTKKINNIFDETDLKKYFDECGMIFDRDADADDEYKNCKRK